jgi:hypothetical protein
MWVTSIQVVYIFVGHSLYWKALSNSRKGVFIPLQNWAWYCLHFKNNYAINSISQTCRTFKIRKLLSGTEIVRRMQQAHSLQTGILLHLGVVVFRNSTINYRQNCRIPASCYTFFQPDNLFCAVNVAVSTVTDSASAAESTIAQGVTDYFCSFTSF